MKEIKIKNRFSKKGERDMLLIFTLSFLFSITLRQASAASDCSHINIGKSRNILNHRVGSERENVAVKQQGAVQNKDRGEIESGEGNHAREQVLELLEKLERPEGYAVKTEIINMAEKEGIPKQVVIKEIEGLGYRDERVNDKAGRSLVVVRISHRQEKLDLEEDAIEIIEMQKPKKWTKPELQIRQQTVANTIVQLTEEQGKKPTVKEITDAVNRQLANEVFSRHVVVNDIYKDIRKLGLTADVEMQKKATWTTKELRIRRQVVTNSVTRLTEELGRKPTIKEVKDEVNRLLSNQGFLRQATEIVIRKDIKKLGLEDAVRIREKAMWTKPEFQIRRQIVAESIVRLTEGQEKKPTVTEVKDEVNRQLFEQDIEKRVTGKDVRNDVTILGIKDAVETQEREKWPKPELQVRRQLVTSSVTQLTEELGRKPTVKEIIDAVNHQLANRGVSRQISEIYIYNDIERLGLEDAVRIREKATWTKPEFQIRRQLVASSIVRLAEKQGRKPTIKEVTDEVNSWLPLRGIKKHTTEDYVYKDIKKLGLEDAVRIREKAAWSTPELQIRRQTVTNSIVWLTEEQGAKPTVKEVTDEVNRQLSLLGIAKHVTEDYVYKDIERLGLEDAVKIREKAVWTKSELQIRRQVVTNSIVWLTEEQGEKPTMREVTDEANRRFSNRGFSRRATIYDIRRDIKKLGFEDKISIKKYENRIKGIAYFPH